MAGCDGTPGFQVKHVKGGLSDVALVPPRAGKMVVEVLEENGLPIPMRMG